MYQLLFKWLNSGTITLIWLGWIASGWSAVLAADDDFFPYDIVILQPGLDKQLHPLLQSELQRDREGLKLAGLRMSGSKLIRREMELLARILRSEGYYSNSVSYKQVNGAVEYRAVPGRAFHIAQFTIGSPQADITLPSPDRLGLKVKQF